MIKLIETPQNKYLYDSNLHKVYKICIDEWTILKQYDEKYILQGDVLTSRFIEKGIGLPSYVEKVFNPFTDIIEDVLESNLQLLILQVTQNCNLRCEYCVYSGNYTGRQHACEKMTYETAQSAIDFFLNKSADDTLVTVNFYGGEPLLNFELIEKSVRYIENVYGRRKVAYGITTNGMLLNEKIMNFLEKKRFHTVISLDGNAKENDKNRKLKNGKGTFEIVYENLIKIQENYPRLWDKTSFNRVKAPNHNLRECEAFFEKNELFKNKKVRAEYVTDNNIKKEIQYAENDIEYEILMESKALLGIIGKIRNEKLNNAWNIYKQDMERTLYNLRMGRKLQKIAHPSGVCVPGKDRLFVNTKGQLFPCERCNELSPAMQIGNVKEGFCYEKIRQQINVGVLTEECRECWAFQMCNICQSQSDREGKLSSEARRKKCNKVKKLMEQKLASCCFISEWGG